MRPQAGPKQERAGPLHAQAGPWQAAAAFGRKQHCAESGAWHDTAACSERRPHERADAQKAVQQPARALACTKASRRMVQA